MLVVNVVEAERLVLQVEERLAKRTEEESLKALQTSPGNSDKFRPRKVYMLPHIDDEDFKNQVERVIEENSTQAANLERLKSEESEKEGTLTGFTLWKKRERSKASPPPTTTLQLPPNKQASGPDQLGKPGPAEYYKTEDGRYGCLKCGSSYTAKRSLKRHTKYVCGVQAQFQCADCLRKFKLKSNLKEHIVNKICHNGRNKNCLGPAEYYKTEDGRYGCLKCASSYKHKSNLNQHKKYECGVQAQFECANCLRKFKHKGHLKSHIAYKSCHNRRNKNRNGPAEYYKTEDGRYGCLKCASSYKHKSNLNQHKKYECGVQAQFQCADCLRKFKHKGNLKEHIVKKCCHNPRNKNRNGPAEYYKTEDGRYGCLKCGSSYKVKCSLKRHTKYQCDV